MSRVEIFTDGACSGNPGPGGWGAILRFGEATRELNGGAEETTNNRMELTAAIEALNALIRVAPDEAKQMGSTMLQDADPRVVRVAQRAAAL